jgi:hypothetical protein
MTLKPRERLQNRLSAAPNLDDPRLAPYTSAVPEMDEIFDSRAAFTRRKVAGIEEDFKRCRGAAN